MSAPASGRGMWLAVLKPGSLTMGPNTRICPRNHRSWKIQKMAEQLQAHLDAASRQQGGASMSVTMCLGYTMASRLSPKPHIRISPVAYPHRKLIGRGVLGNVVQPT